MRSALYTASALLPSPSDRRLSAEFNNALLWLSRLDVEAGFPVSSRAASAAGVPILPSAVIAASATVVSASSTNRRRSPVAASTLRFPNALIAVTRFRPVLVMAV